MSRPGRGPVPARVAHATAGPLVVRRLRAVVEGAAHVPGAGGVLLAANHLSFLDHFLLAAASPRPMLFLGKAELARGVAGRLNQAFGMIPVDRGSADLAALDVVVAALRAGEVVGVFPEGTRSPTGELHRFRSGLARLAASAQVPIVPVGLSGTADVWPRHARPSLRRPPVGTLAVRFGPVVPAPQPTPRGRRVCTEAVRAGIAALTGQALVERLAPIEAPPAADGGG